MSLCTCPCFCIECRIRRSPNPDSGPCLKESYFFVLSSIKEGHFKVTALNGPSYITRQLVTLKDRPAPRLHIYCPHISSLISSVLNTPNPKPPNPIQRRYIEAQEYDLPVVATLNCIEERTQMPPCLKSEAKHKQFMWALVLIYACGMQ